MIYSLNFVKKVKKKERGGERRQSQDVGTAVKHLFVKIKVRKHIIGAAARGHKKRIILEVISPVSQKTIVSYVT